MKTVLIPITGLGLDAPMIQKVSRYLDVTRSALLFGNRALLVEGIAEALLTPVIARKCVLNNDPHALQRFRDQDTVHSNLVGRFTGKEWRFIKRYGCIDGRPLTKLNFGTL